MRRGICHKVVQPCRQQLNTAVFNVGQTSWTIPANVTVLQRVGAWAAGGGAANGAMDAGGGGAYSENDNVAVTPGNTLSFLIGAHGLGGAASTTGLAGTAGGDTSVSYLGSQILLGGRCRPLNPRWLMTQSTELVRGGRVSGERVPRSNTTRS